MSGDAPFAVIRIYGVGEEGYAVVRMGEARCGALVAAMSAAYQNLLAAKGRDHLLDPEAYRVRSADRVRVCESIEDAVAAEALPTVREALETRDFVFVDGAALRADPGREALAVLAAGYDYAFWTIAPEHDPLATQESSGLQVDQVIEALLMTAPAHGVPACFSFLAMIDGQRAVEVLEDGVGAIGASSATSGRSCRWWTWPRS